MEMNFSCTFIALEIKLISGWKVVHQDSFWNRGKRQLQLGNGLLFSATNSRMLYRTEMILGPVYQLIFYNIGKCDEQF